MTESLKEESQRKLLATLSEMGGERTTEEDLVFSGSKFVIPANMSAKDALEWLRDYIDQQEEPSRFHRTFYYRPWDGAHALQEALRRMTGMSGTGKAIETFFGSIPPSRHSIKVDVDETVQVPWGKLKSPLFRGTLMLNAQNVEEYGPVFVLNVEAPRKYASAIEGLFQAVEAELATNSIYKGKAIDGQTSPEFMDLSGVDPEQVIYSQETTTQLEANVWTLLRHTSRLRDMDLPLKRAVLLEGPYGCGKTLAAFVTAQVAVANGWTFIYCRPGKDDLDQVMGTARLYQPACVFFEDIDTIASEGGITRLLDMFDGIQTKGTEILAILTTNHPERIHKGMVRPGRLDSVIHIGALDAGGVMEMIRKSVPVEQLSTDLDEMAIGEAMADFAPAFVKEAIDRAVRYSVARNDGELEVLGTDDFVSAATGLRPQLALMQEAEEGQNQPTLQSLLGEQITEQVRGVLDGSALVHPMDDDEQIGILHPNRERR